MLPAIDRLATIVVCEDDAATRELLCDNLEADRYEALAAGTAEEALRLCRYGTPDALIVDIGLPDASGLDVIREIRAATDAAAPFDADLPIVVLSGRGSDGDRVRGLRAGADDYLVKPYFYDELLERARRLLERRSSHRGGPVRVGLLSIDPATREVRVGERAVELANKEFELLRALAAEPERVFTKEELLRDVWGVRDGRADADARLACQPAPSQARSRPWHLRPSTCWGVGYRLVGG